MTTARQASKNARLEDDVIAFLSTSRRESLKVKPGAARDFMAFIKAVHTESKTTGASLAAMLSASDWQHVPLACVTPHTTY
jgi:hypothetical protein